MSKNNILNILSFLKRGQGGTKYFMNNNREDAELQESLNSMKVDRQKDAMMQIIASMTTGKDVSKLFPDVVKIIRTKNIDLKKLVYLYLINYARVKPDLIFLAVASFHSDAKEGETPLIRGLAVRTMGCIRVPEIVSYLCETLSWCLKDKEAYVRKTAALCVSKLYATSPELVRENGFIDILHECLKDENANVVANAMSALNEISILSGVNQLKLKSKNLKMILDAMAKAGEWGQVQILNALILYNPKKSIHAEEVIEGVIPRLSHANQSVVMSAVKVILKFMDLIDDINKVKSYCKKLTNSIMTILISYPEIQYVLLRSLHAIVIKRPMLLDKEFKYFYVQYNDPIYIKLEKVDILYKLCDKKNYEMIIKEFTSYSLTETNIELIRKSVRYIGYVGYKYESSLNLCVNCLTKILDNNNEYSTPECIIVARDLMRKYKGEALNLIDKINLDLINSLNDQNAKSAALYIIGEFCEQIPKSTEIIKYYVDNFSNEELNSKVRLQILNSAVKNFLTKPEESEEIVKDVLQRGAEESENPDIRDRAYIYWRLLEQDPDVAKQMICGEKPSFKFTEDDELDVDTIDDMINNMTNVSACYFKKEKDMINEEDLIADKEAIKEKEELEKAKAEKKGKKKEKKRKKKKKKKIDAEEQQIDEADLIGLDDNNITESIKQESEKEKEKPKEESKTKNNAPPQTNQANLYDDIFGIFNNTNANSGSNANNNSSNMTPALGMLDFSGGANSQNMPKQIFNNVEQCPTTLVKKCTNDQNMEIYSQFQRANGQLNLGLYFPKGGSSCQLNLNKNSFGLICQNNSNINNNIAIFPMSNNNQNTDGQAPSSPFIVNGSLNYNGQMINIKLQVDLFVLFKEDSKLLGEQFLQFFNQNKDKDFNKNEYIYNNKNNEEEVKTLFEKKNIYFSAKQNNVNPPISFYSGNILGGMSFLIEAYLKDGTIHIKLVVNNSKIIPVLKETIDIILS